MLHFIFLFLSPLAYACAACGFGDDGSRNAFLFTTALLTIVPLGVMSAVAYFMYLKSKKRGQNE